MNKCPHEHQWRWWTGLGKNAQSCFLPPRERALITRSSIILLPRPQKEREEPLIALKLDFSGLQHGVSTGPPTDLNVSLNHFWAQQGKLRLYFWPGLMHRSCSCALPHPTLFPSPLVTVRPIFQKEKSFLNHLATGFGTSCLRLLEVQLYGQGKARAGVVHLQDVRASCLVHTFLKGVGFWLQWHYKLVQHLPSVHSCEFGQKLSSTPRLKQQHSQSSFQEWKEATEKTQGRFRYIIYLNILKISINNCSLPAAAIEWRK